MRRSITLALLVLIVATSIHRGAAAELALSMRISRPVIDTPSARKLAIRVP